MGYVTYCSMCLGTDIKLYQMNSSMIAKYNELILRRYKMNLNPMYACFECAYLLQKYCEFQAKCCRANNILRITSHGSFEVTEQNLKEIDRKQNKLQSLLSMSGAVTDDYQHQQDCMETQVTHKDIKLESPVHSIEEQCNENTIQRQLEKLEASAIEASRVFNTDQSENSQIYTALISNIKTTLEEDNNYQNINELNTACFDYNSNEESTFVGMPDEENVVLSEIKVDEVYPTKLDVERSDNNCETEILEQPETVVTTISDGNKIGSRKRKCISEENNKIPSKKRININEDKNLNKNKTERRKGSRITAKKKEDCRYKISSRFFKDHMTIIELSPEDARCELLLRKESRNFKMSSHKCDLCYRGFISEATYLAHMKKHSLEYGAIKCDICQLNFSNKQSVSKHWAMCHSWKLLCKACSYLCFNVNQAKNHIESHNGKKYTCKECGETFRFPNTLSTHMRIKHNTELACEFCGSMFASALGMKCHKSLRHKKEKNELLGPKCDECSVHFASELAWKRHRVLCSRHQVQNGCRVCGESFSTQQELKAHSRTHGPRNTTVHSRPRVIKDFKPIPCELCEKELPSRKAYVKHMNTEHPETKTDKELMSRCVCEVCGKAFKHPSCLIAHQRKHTDEKPFSCQHCGKKFKNEYALKMHLPVHTNEYSFKCHLCEKAFGDRGRLNAHVKRHLGIRPYKCSYCDKSFTFQCEERLHTKYVHCKEPYPKRDRRKRSVKREDATNYITDI